MIDLIAEISWNHLGDMRLAESMVHAAKESGADYVKFQTWKVDRLKPGPWDNDGRRAMYEKSELSEQDHYKLRDACNEVNVKFLTSCFCIEDLEFIRLLSHDVKIPSPECLNKDLIKNASQIFDNVFVSTGAVSQQEFEFLFDFKNVVVLHCISSYPCLPEHFHLNKFNYIKSKGKKFGFSGHMSTIWDAVFAISHGATVIEKHFTIDNNLPGRDNKFALLPKDFSNIRNYADCFIKMQILYDNFSILDSETEYRKYHARRWG